MAGIELHDEIVEWMSSLDTNEWDRTVVVIDRLADLRSIARMPFSRALGAACSNCDLRSARPHDTSATAYRFTKGNRIILLTTLRKQRNTNVPRSPRHDRSPTSVLVSTRRGRIMANYSRWEDIKKQRPDPADDTRTGVEQDFALAS